MHCTATTSPYFWSMGGGQPLGPPMPRSASVLLHYSVLRYYCYYYYYYYFLCFCVTSLLFRGNSRSGGVLKAKHFGLLQQVLHRSPKNNEEDKLL